MDDEVIWGVMLDKKYEIKVFRTGDYTGDLVISEAGKELHREKVILSYRAIFGPDVADVAHWQAKAIKFVDSIKPAT